MFLRFASRICIIDQSKFDWLCETKQPIESGVKPYYTTRESKQFLVGGNTLSKNAAMCVMSGISIENGNKSLVGHFVPNKGYLSKYEPFLKSRLSDFSDTAHSAIIIGGYQSGKHIGSMLVDKIKDFFKKKFRSHSEFLYSRCYKSLLYINKRDNDYPDTWFIGINDICSKYLTLESVDNHSSTN